MPNRGLGYLAALAATAVAAAVRWLLDPWLDDQIPLVTFYGAVAVAVWVGGSRPAVLVVAGGYLAADYLFIEPRYTLGLESARGVIGLAAYLVSCGIIIGFGESLRSARRRADRQRADLERVAAEQRATEELARAEGRQVQLVADAVPALIAYVDADGRYRLNNHAYEVWFGHPRGELVGKHMREVLGEAAWAAIRPHVESALAGNVVSYEAAAPYRDGGTRWISATYTPDVGADGRVRGFVAHVTDITARNRAEEALRESEERFRRTFECNMVPMGVWTLEGELAEANDALLDLIGYTREDLRAGRVRWRAITPPEYVPLDDRALEQIRERGVSDRYEKEFVRGDGRRVPVLVAGASFTGCHDRGVFFAIDLTDRKRAEADLREADRKKDEFLAILAHELRNPLAPLRNGLQVLRLAGINGQAERVREMMDRQLGNLVRLVDDLLDVSRITRGKLELRRERVGLKEVIETAVETARPVVEQGRHELRITVTDEPIVVDADPARLAQVVANLLNNAAKYTPPGGHITVTAGVEGDTARVVVADDGLGIPPPMLDKVFDLFTQVDRRLEKSTGGLGIGLSLVKGLVEMHGGTVEARSAGEGRGSEFVVRLPAVATATGNPDHPGLPADEVRPAGRRVILVVDDNLDAADSLAQLLEVLGNEVHTAYDGQAAVERAAELRPDLVLMDIGMPRMNGYDAARRIREQPGGQDIVLVALTGWGQEDDRTRSSAAGFDFHLVKPVDAPTLTKLLNEFRPVTA